MNETVMLLKKYNIPFETWGQGSAKTLTHFEKDVAEGEMIFTENSDGELVSEMSVLYVDVFHRTENGVIVLYEDRQEFRDGRIRRRDWLNGSVAEKLKFREQADILAVLRALREELGVNRVSTCRHIKKWAQTEESQSYPGIIATYTNHKWEVWLHPEDFIPEGYVEVQEDKSTYFLWRALQET